MHTPSRPGDVPMTNAVQDKLRAGTPVFGAIVTIPSPAVMRLMAIAGFDLLLIDMEHGPIGLADAHAMILATAGTPAVPMVRIAENLPWLAKPAIDSGALGVCVPMVCTRDQAERAVAAIRYPGEGTRLWGPFHAPARWQVSMPQYMVDVNACMTSMVTIEHPDAIEAASAIATVPGLDVAIIGPGDLATSMGYVGDSSQPAVREAIERAEGALLNSAVALGGVAKDPDAAMAMVRRGYKMIFLGVDAMFLARGAAAALGNLSTAAARC